MPDHPSRFLAVLGVSIFFLTNSFLPAWGAAYREEDGTRFYERRPAVITRTDTVQLRRLIRRGLTLDPVRPETIRAYVNEEEFRWVRSRGWEIQWVPDEELPYWSEPKGVSVPFTTPLTFYPTFDQLTADLQVLAASHPDLCRLVSIGTSVQGRDLWFLKITDNPDREENEPEVKLISTMHGNEIVGVALLVNLIHELLEKYPTDPRIRDLVDSTEIWIMPLMNPDGYSANPRSRYTAAGVDLNRDFPDPILDNTNTPQGRAKETQAVMKFAFAHASVLSANMHTGSLVVNYPFDHKYSPSPDDDVFVHISRTYADNNPPMATNNSVPSFDNGIVRGALWYVINGGMQDWNYLWLGCNEVTLELSEDFEPAESSLVSLWNDNRESLLAYMEQAHIGVHGRVTDASSGMPLAATVTVVGRDHPVFTDPEVGDYHRMLLDGRYDLRFQAKGYEVKTVSGVVVTDGTPTFLDVALERVSSYWLLR